MKKSVIRYGLYSAITLIVLFLASLLIGKNLDYTMQEIIGYASILISLSFVFFGIKHFRDQENNGSVTLGKALLIGILISLMASFTFGVFDLIYVKYINPGFMEDYYTQSLQNLKESLPAAEFEVQKAKLESEKDLFMNPYMSFVLMFITVFVIGFIVSLISSLILQRKPQNA